MYKSRNKSAHLKLAQTIDVSTKSVYINSCTIRTTTTHKRYKNSRIRNALTREDTFHLVLFLYIIYVTYVYNSLLEKKIIENNRVFFILCLNTRYNCREEIFILPVLFLYNSGCYLYRNGLKVSSHLFLF